MGRQNRDYAPRIKAILGKSDLRPSSSLLVRQPKSCIMKANEGYLILAIDFGSTLHHDLANVSNASNALTSASLDRHIEYAISLPPSSLKLQDRITLDALGTKLWNACTRLLRSPESDGEGRKLISHGLIWASFPLSTSD